MNEETIRGSLDDLGALALTMHFEAQGDASEGGSSVEERIAVGCVIRNRAVANGNTIKSVCLAPKQFSCWNPGTDHNHLALMVAAQAFLQGESLDALLRETHWLAKGIVNRVIIDRTHGATHYYAPTAMIPPGRVPSWAQGKTPAAHIGRQIFYRL